MPNRGDPRVQLLSDLADPTRFGILELLERGPMTATAIAQQLDVSATQLANHLRRLRDSELVAVEHDGRLAIYHLAEPGLREIFSMLNGLRRTPTPASRRPPDAVSCYDHLAGTVGVALLDHLLAQKALLPRHGEGQLQLGPTAASTFATLGIDDPTETTRRMPAYACLDSNLRRPHLGGQLGAELAHSLRSRGWTRDGDRPRQLVLTAAGRRGLAKLGIAM